MRVNLSGIVAYDDDVEIYKYFGYNAFSPKTVRDALAENPKGEELVLEINSVGGSVEAGNEIYSVLRAAEDVETRAEIQSLAASAASYLALGCKRVEISPVASMMVHLPLTATYGNRNDHLDSVQMLDTLRDGILNAYELKCAGKTSRAELKRMMNSSLWLSAQECVRCGLADAILGDDAQALSPTDAMNAAFGMPDIAKLRAQYRAALLQSAAPTAPSKREPLTDATGEAPVADKRDWQARARLAVEKIRF